MLDEEDDLNEIPPDLFNGIPMETPHGKRPLSKGTRDWLQSFRTRYQIEEDDRTVLETLQKKRSAALGSPEIVGLQKKLRAAERVTIVIFDDKPRPGPARPGPARAWSNAGKHVCLKPMGNPQIGKQQQFSSSMYVFRRTCVHFTLASSFLAFRHGARHYLASTKERATVSWPQDAAASGTAATCLSSSLPSVLLSPRALALAIEQWPSSGSA